MSLPPEIEELIAALKRQIAALEAEVAELRRRLDLDSSTSSKPPSSDGFNKKSRAVSLREASGRPSGGQKGHKGGTLRQVADPDHILRHGAETCVHCRALLAAEMQEAVEKRQVFDLCPRPLVVTEHQIAIYRCAACGFVTKAAFPADVAAPAQYGESLKAAAVYLNVQQLIPEDRAAQALQDLFGAPWLSPASIACWVRQKARDLAPVHARIGQSVAKAKVRCLDETGLTVAKAITWLHTTSSERLTFYRIGPQRGAVPDELKGGVVVHDHFLAYQRLRACVHAFCNAHHLRELKALADLDGEAWAKPVSAMLAEANEAVRKARQNGAASLDPQTVEAFRQRFDAVIDAGLAFHAGLPEPPQRQPKARGGHKRRRPGLNLLIRLKQFKDETLRFLADFDTPFTNNLAERDLRMMKLKMKISGCFRTIVGAQNFATLRSVISTAAKQKQNILQILSANPQNIIQKIAA